MPQAYISAMNLPTILCIYNMRACAQKWLMQLHIYQKLCTYFTFLYHLSKKHMSSAFFAVVHPVWAHVQLARVAVGPMKYIGMGKWCFVSQMYPVQYLYSVADCIHASISPATGFEYCTAFSSVCFSQKMLHKRNVFAHFTTLVFSRLPYDDFVNYGAHIRLSSWH